MPGRCRKLFVFLNSTERILHVPTTSKNQVGGYADDSFWLGGDERAYIVFSFLRPLTRFLLICAAHVFAPALFS